MEAIGAHIPEECVNPLRGILAAIDTSVSLESEQYQDMEQRSVKSCRSLI